MAWVLALAVSCAAPRANRPGNRPAPLVIQDQGSFAVGGTVVTAPGTFDPIRHGAYNPADQSVAGRTLHGDHAYVFYQVPANPRRLPLVMWHGHGQSAKTWETTPDGREGFQNIFLRRRFPVYLVDQPRRGRASRSTVAMNLTAAPDEQLWFGIFRLGVWPNFFPGVQFSQKEEALDQFFRQMVPNTGPFDMEVSSSAVSALFDRIGPGILVTHSQSGGLGWRTAIKNQNVRAIVSYEPGSNFPFPEGEAPATGVATAAAGAQDTPNIVIIRSGTRPSRVAPQANFTGVVRVLPLFDSVGASRASGSSVSFEAGARTAWHSHPLGQTLIVTAGVGRVQRWGTAAEEIRRGDVVWIPPGVRHWHGASPTRVFAEPR